MTLQPVNAQDIGYSYLTRIVEHYIERPNEAKVMLLLASADRSFGEITAQTGMTDGNLNPLLKRLSSRGYVSKRGNSAPVWGLTKVGRTLADAWTVHICALLLGETDEKILSSYIKYLPFLEQYLVTIVADKRVLLPVISTSLKHLKRRGRT